MPRKKEPPTFEELRVQRQNEWAEKQALARQQIGALHAQLLKMPDVQMAPDPDVPWSHQLLSCAKCAKKEFLCRRYVTVNGVRYRVECECTGCGHVDTWDWNMQNWMGG